MSLRIGEIVKDVAAVLDELGLSTEPGAEDALSLAAFRVGAAAPGRHELDECAKIEREWRSSFLGLVQAIVSSNECCLLYASGPMYQHGLPELLPFVAGSARKVGMFHIEGVTFVEPTGFVYGRCAFEFDAYSCREMLQQETIDLESIRLYGLIAGHDAVRDVLTDPIWTIPPRWFVENRALALAPFSHFEGCTVIGERSRAEMAREIVAELIAASPQG
jgi:hypothetical protein